MAWAVTSGCGRDATPAGDGGATGRPSATVPTPRPPAVTRPEGTATPLPAGSVAPSPRSPAAAHPVRPEGLPRVAVIRVVDGDTVDVRLDGRGERVRLIGINTPESVDPRRPVQCFGKEAAAKARELLENQNVWLEADAGREDRDDFGRLLRYVWLPDGRMFNLEMLLQGYANAFTVGAPHAYDDLFRRAARAARDGKTGLWSPATCDGDFNRSPAPNR